MTSEIRSLSHHRDYLKKKAIRHNTPRYHELYKDCRNNLNRLIKDTKSNYFKHKLENSKNSKEGWKVINELLNQKSKSTIINELKNEHTTVTGDKNIADEFNKFFSTIGPKLCENLPNNNIDPLSYIAPGSNIFSFKDFTYADVKYEIDKTKLRNQQDLTKFQINF